MGLWGCCLGVGRLRGLRLRLGFLRLDRTRLDDEIAHHWYLRHELLSEVRPLGSGIGSADSRERHQYRHPARNADAEEAIERVAAGSRCGKGQRRGDIRHRQLSAALAGPERKLP